MLNEVGIQPSMMGILDNTMPRDRLDTINVGGATSGQFEEGLDIERETRLYIGLFEVPVRKLAAFAFCVLYRPAITLIPQLPQKPRL
jgi:hypothetical protein